MYRGFRGYTERNSKIGNFQGQSLPEFELSEAVTEAVSY